MAPPFMKTRDAPTSASKIDVGGDLGITYDTPSAAVA